MQCTCWVHLLVTPCTALITPSHVPAAAFPPGYAFMTGGRMMGRGATGDAGAAVDMKQLEQVGDGVMVDRT